MDEQKPDGPSPSPPRSNKRVAGTRRSFLRWTGVAAAGAAVAVVGTKVLTSGGAKGTTGLGAGPEVTLPSPASTLPTQTRALSSVTDLEINGLTPLITPNAEFFRIDMAFSVPNVDLNAWRLKIKGKVRTPLSFSYEELLAMEQVEAPVTLACVSNRVGDNLIGTAVWQGVELRTLLDRAGVDPARRIMAPRHPGRRRTPCPRRAPHRLRATSPLARHQHRHHRRPRPTRRRSHRA